MSPRQVTTEVDEFRFLRDCAEEAGLEWSGQPTVERRHVDVDGRALSSLVWGATPPRLVLIHGGAQNAHTWDTVALVLAEPLVSVDLPGHGHSSWRDAQGKKADLNVIDHKALTLRHPRPAFDLPAGGGRLLQEASGYVATIVNGEVTRRHGIDTGQRPGRLIRGAR
jgi:hypothetical protein